MSFMYKSMGAKHSNWQVSRNNQYVTYALLSLGAVYNVPFFTEEENIVSFIWVSFFLWHRWRHFFQSKYCKIIFEIKILYSIWRSLVWLKRNF